MYISQKHYNRSIIGSTGIITIIHRIYSCRKQLIGFQMANNTFPNVYINVQDKSSSANRTFTRDPLHRPLVASFAEQGPIGVPIYGDGASQARIFGNSLLDPTGPFSQTLNYQYLNRISRGGKFWFLRLDDGSDTLGFAIFAISTIVKQAPVYQQDAEQNIITIPTDPTKPNSIYQTDASGAVKRADQTQYNFVTYPISKNNPLTNEAVASYFNTDVSTVKNNYYMLISITGTSPGNHMTRNAISLDVSSPSSDNINTIQSINAPLIRLYPRYCSDSKFNYLTSLMTNTNYTYDTIQNIYGSNYVDFCPTQESVINSSTDQDFGWSSIIETAYTSNSNGWLLDYDVNVNVYGGTPMDQRGNIFKGTWALAQAMYNDTMSAQGGTPVTDISNMTRSQFQSINQINPFTGQDINGFGYIVLPFGTTSINGTNVTARFGRYSNLSSYDKTSIGQVKSITDANIDAATGAYFDVNTGNTQNLADPFAVSFNFMYDPGWSFSTKNAVANLYDLRDDVKIDWTTETYMTQNSKGSDNLPKWMPTQPPVRKANDMASSLSALAAVSQTVTSHGVDSEFGTQSFRGEIFPQSGYLTSNGNRRIVIPTNYERLLERLAYYNGPAVSGTPKGRPGNVLTSFSKLSWTPKTDDQKQTIWGQGANYATYADTNVLFFPDLRTIYNNESSLLSSGTFTDYIIFLKHIIRVQWTYYVGMETPISRLINDIERSIDSEAFQAFGQYMTTETTVELQDANTDNDYTAMITTQCYGNMPDRIWKVVLTPIRNTINVPSNS